MDNLENLTAIPLVYTIDELGRIVLPNAVCETMNWYVGTRLSLYLYPEEKAIILEPYNPE